MSQGRGVMIGMHILGDESSSMQRGVLTQGTNCAYEAAEPTAWDIGC